MSTPPRMPELMPKHPHSKRLTELSAERITTCQKWGVNYWILGPEHEETVKHAKRILEIDGQLKRLMVEGLMP